MKKIRWQLVIILLTGLIVGVLLITQKQPSSPTTLAPEPTTGGIYTEGLIGSYQRFNPMLDIYNTADRDVDRLLFSGLVRFDSSGQPQPDLAEKWGINADGTTYNFRLRSGLVWHDGKPITSDDVIFTVNLLKDTSSYVPEDIQAFWKDVKIIKLDDLTFQFLLPEAFAPFLDYLTVGILPKHLLANLSLDKIVDSQFNAQPVGSGPYRFDHLIVDNDQVKGVVLNLFDKYYDKKPFIQQVVFRYYPDAQSVYQAYQANEIQGISQVTGDILSKVLADPNLALYTGRQPQLTLVLFNLNNNDVPFLQDPKVRRALTSGLNRQWIVDHILNGQAILADGPLFPGSWAYYDNIDKVSFDQTTAAAQLKDDGYALPTEGEKIWAKGDKPIAFQLLYPDGEPYKTIAESIQKDWTNMNVKISLKAVPYDQLISDNLEPRDYQAALVDQNLSRLPDPDPYPFWDQAEITGGQNYAQWNDRTVSEYIEQARVTNDQAERVRLYRSFQVLFVKQMPAIPLFYPVYTYAVDKQVQGVQMGPLYEPSDRFNTITQWFLVAKKNNLGNTPSPTATH